MRRQQYDALRVVALTAIAVAVVTCGAPASQIPSETPSASTQETPLGASARTFSASPTVAGKPWPIGLTRANVAVTLHALGFEQFPTPMSFTSGTIAKPGGRVRLFGDDSYITGIEAGFLPTGEENMAEVIRLLSSAGNGSEIADFFQDQLRRFNATRDAAKEELEVPGAIVQWEVKPTSLGAQITVSVGEY